MAAAPNKTKLNGTALCKVDPNGLEDPVCFLANLRPLANQTAHGRLVDKLEKQGIIDPENDMLVGGSIKKDGTIALKSETLNRKTVGLCDATGTDLGDAVAAQLSKLELITPVEARGRPKKK